ncbi:MAG: glycosyltransferase [Chloroflexi bacterium]|nr:glycosyltransferase [Chloroflexota bacterium]
MKILFISRWFPYPPDNGSKIRIFNLIKHLALRHEIHLISFTSAGITDEQQAAMAQYCQRVDVAHYKPFHPSRLKALLGFFSSQPRSVIDTHSIEMQQLVEHVGGTTSFDAVIASQIDVAPYATVLSGPIKILEEVELTTLYEQYARQHDPLKKLRRGLMWWKWSSYVANLLRVFDGCTVVSKSERARISQVLAGYPAIEIIPNGVDIAHYTADFGLPTVDTLVYSGALTYLANFDAVDFFLRQVFPLIRTERPQVKLAITGKLDGVPTDRLPLSSNNGVVFTGYLDDVRPTVARSWVSIVPLLWGGGTRLKILEALALGTPVVATSKGVEGLDLTSGRDLLIADTPADFAAAVLRLLQDPTLHATLSRNGRQAVEAKYDWQMIGQQFNDFIETTVAQTKVLSS